MIIQETEIPEVLHIIPTIYHDVRGYFVEVYNPTRLNHPLLQHLTFLQDNQSVSKPGVLRGLHLQHPCGQAKLVHVLMGSIFDVAVDVRVDSPTFGKWVSRVLSAETHEQLFIPSGFAHGFCVLGDQPAAVLYKCSELYQPRHERTIAWDDPDLGIDWPTTQPIVNAKDAAAPRLRDIPEAQLPHYCAHVELAHR